MSRTDCSLTFVLNDVLTCCHAQYYRYYILWQCPKIRFLDYQKVKDAERARANELFGSHDSPTDLAKSIMAVRHKTPAGRGTTASTGNGMR